MIPGKTYTIDDVVAIAWRRKWILVLPFLIGTAGAVYYAHWLPNLYRSETVILVVPQRVPESYVRSTVTMRIEDRLRSITPQIQSRTRLEQVINELDLFREERAAATMDEIIARMRDAIEVDPVRGDSFRIGYVSTDPRIAMRVADRLASLYIQENHRDREALARGTSQFLESQLEEARVRLLEHERKLEDYRRQYAGELPTQLESNLQVIQNMQLQLQTLADSINRDRDRRLMLERTLSEAMASKTLPPQIEDTKEPTGPPSAYQRLVQAREELRNLERRYKPTHPSVIAQRRVIADLETLAAADGQSPTQPPSSDPTETIRLGRLRQIQAEIDRLDRQVADKEKEAERLQALAKEYQRRVEAVPAHESQMTELMRDYETVQRLYASLAGKREESQIATNLEQQQIGEQFKVLDPAHEPDGPFSPNRPRLSATGAIGGLLFGIVLVALLEYRDTSLRTERDIVEVLQLPTLALVPIIPSLAERRRRRILVMTALSSALVAGVALAAWTFGLVR